MTRIPGTIVLLSLLLAGAAHAQQPEAADPCARGEQYFREDNYIAAEPYLRQCLAQEESLRSLLPLLMITVLQERPEDGKELGQRALALDAQNARVRYWLGRAHLLAGETDLAAEQWEAGLVLDVNHAGILEALARLSLRQGDDARAYNLLLQLRMQGGDDLWLHQLLATIARRRGLWDQAAIHWRDIVDIQGETEENLVVLGELHILAGEAEKAVDVFRHAVQVLPTGATWGGLGEAWFSMNEVDSAVVALRRAVELDPANPHNRFNLANSLQIKGDLVGAEEQFLTYLEIQPDDPVGHFKYGVHLELRGEEARALAEVEKAVSLEPRYIEALVVLAQMYESRGRVDEALSTIARLEQLDPGAAAELSEWRARVEDERSESEAALAAGKVHLRHLVTSPDAAAEVSRELAAGKDFGVLATRFSHGPTAASGGDIGWVDPQDMMPSVRDAIRALAPGETAGPIDAGGAAHFFERVR